MYWPAPAAAVAMLVFGVVFAVGGAKARVGVAEGGGIVLVVAAGLILVWGLVKLRPLVVVDGQVRIARGLRTDVIALSEVSGIGLLFQYMPRNSKVPPGWCLTIWGREEQSDRVDQFLVTAWTWRPQPGAVQGWVLPDDDPVALARSRAGRVAAGLDSLVVAAQGPDGSLRTRQLQKHVVSARWGQQTLAYWSPDGVGASPG
jgi:hypothetical protein